MWRSVFKSASEPSNCRKTSEPSGVRWAGWAKAVVANKPRNLEAEESHCYSAGEPHFRVTWNLLKCPLGISGLMCYAELIQSLCSA